MVFVSLDTGKAEQVAAVNAEMEQTLGTADDPLQILILAEEEYDLICIPHDE